MKKKTVSKKRETFTKMREVTLPKPVSQSAEQYIDINFKDKKVIGVEFTGKIEKHYNFINQFGQKAESLILELTESNNGYEKGSKVRMFVPARLKKLLAHVDFGGRVSITYLGKVDMDNGQPQHDFKVMAEKPIGTEDVPF